MALVYPGLVNIDNSTVTVTTINVYDETDTIITEDLSNQIGEGNSAIRGLMLESHLIEGNQSITDNLTYGQSITDACMNWSDTLDCLKNASEAVQKRRG